MIPLGLSAADQERFHRGLVGPSHAVRQMVRLLDMDHNVLSEVTGRVLSGQVDVDAGSDSLRSLSGFTVLDHDGALNLDTGNPNSGGLYLDRMLQVRYGVWSPELPRWVDVPVFTGPITQLSRDGDVVSLSAVDKSSLLRTPASFARTWKKGTRKTTIVRELLASMGEQFLEIPDWPDKTVAPVSIASKSVVWDFLQSLVRSFGDVRLAYDGRGYLVLKRHSGNVRWTFRSGDGGSLVTMPKVAYNTAEVANFVVVQGGIPKGGKANLVKVAHTPKAHPLSAVNLGRGGKPRYIRLDIEDDAITDPKRAQALANNTLAQRQNGAVQVDFDALVIPHLEPWDVVAVAPPEWTWRMQLDKFSVPLGADGHMAVGRTGITRTFKRPRKVARKGPARRPAPKKTSTRKATKR